MAAMVLIVPKHIKAEDGKSAGWIFGYTPMPCPGAMKAARKKARLENLQLCDLRYEAVARFFGRRGFLR